MDLISVIIPVYKVESYLNECVESVVKQTYKNLEIILVNDGSPDNCPQICDEWAKKDNRIKVIHKVNGGVSSARNAGLDVANGDYIMFIDSDDVVDFSICENLLQTLNKYHADIVCCNWSKLQKKVKSSNNLVVYAGEQIFALLYNKKVPLLMVPWAKLYKRNVFEEIRYPIGRLHEDEAVIPYVLNKCKVLAYIDTFLYFNRDNAQSITKNFSEKRLDAVWAKEQVLEFVIKNKPQFCQQALQSYLKTIAAYYSFGVLNKIDKQVLKNLKLKFELKYKQLAKRSFSLKLFHTSPKLFVFLFSIFYKKR